MASVAFDYTGWLVRYPEFTSVEEPLAQAYFDEATLYCDNTEVSIVPYDPLALPPVITRATLLNMLTAHIAALYSGVGGAGSSGLVGRISSATEGSVNVSAENNYPAGTPQWYQQTKYGSSFWAATAQWRTMLYRPQASRFGFQPLPEDVGYSWPL